MASPTELIVFKKLSTSRFTADDPAVILNPTLPPIYNTWVTLDSSWWSSHHSRYPSTSTTTTATTATSSKLAQRLDKTLRQFLQNDSDADVIIKNKIMVTVNINNNSNNIAILWYQVVLHRWSGKYSGSLFLRHDAVVGLAGIFQVINMRCDK